MEVKQEFRWDSQRQRWEWKKVFETKWSCYPENLSVLLRTVAFLYLNQHLCLLSMLNIDFSPLE